MTSEELLQKIARQDQIIAELSQELEDTREKYLAYLRKEIERLKKVAKELLE